MNTDGQPGGEQATGELYLTFLLGTERFAMPAAAIREIVNFSPLTEVPLMPDFLPGVLSVRGAVVPVMDLAVRLGLDATVPGRRTCVVIFDLHHGDQCLSIGLMVDMVHAVLPLPAAEADQPIEPHSGVRSGFIEGGLELNGLAVTVLDMQQVLEPGELVELIGNAGFHRSAGSSAEEPGGEP